MAFLLQRNPSTRRSALDLLARAPFQGYAPNDFDIERTENGFTIEIPVAGYAPGQIEVTFEEHVLNIVGKNDRRSFTRSLMLPEEVDADGITAKVEHGLLTLTLPFVPKTQPKQIKVQHASPGEQSVSVAPSSN